jgi:hypothetical protein
MERRFIPEAETVSRTYLPTYCSVVTEILVYLMAQTAHALRPVQVRLNSVSNEGHITLDAENAFRPYHTSHCSGLT